MTEATINREGFLIHFATPEGRRTYAAADREGLAHLVKRYTGLDLDRFTWENGGFEGDGVVVAEGLHIYSGGDSA